MIASVRRANKRWLASDNDVTPRLAFSTRSFCSPESMAVFCRSEATCSVNKLVEAVENLARVVRDGADVLHFLGEVVASARRDRDKAVCRADHRLIGFRRLALEELGRVSMSVTLRPSDAGKLLGFFAHIVRGFGQGRFRRRQIGAQAHRFATPSVL